MQRLCYGAQQCSLARCIGTLTNQNRPMCGIGQTGQAVFATYVALMQSAWSIFVETITTVIGLSLSNDAASRGGVQVRWIDDSFYSVVCSAKDASATFVSIITSTVNVAVQHISSSRRLPAAYLEMGASKIDSNFQLMFTMVMTSVNNLLNQILLGFFYPFMALQKVVVCEANGVVALVSNTGFNVSIGIPEIQAITDLSLGRCLTTMYSENIVSPPEKNNMDAFATLAASITSELTKTTVGAFLEVIKHPLDALFTWTIGIVSGIQDVIQTVDMAHCKLPDFYMQVL